MDARIRLTLTVLRERNSSDPLMPVEAGRLVGLSKSHFLRLFNREVGKGFQRFVREERLREAANLLQDYTLPIKVIAMHAGYSDVSNFYRDFKHSYGVSPRQARLGELRGDISRHQISSL